MASSVPVIRQVSGRVRVKQFNAESLQLAVGCHRSPINLPLYVRDAP